MRLLIRTAIVFFGTLMAAGLVALGAPVVVDFVVAQRAPVPTFTHVQAAPQAAGAHARR